MSCLLDFSGLENKKCNSSNIDTNLICEVIDNRIYFGGEIYGELLSEFEKLKPMKVKRISTNKYINGQIVEIVFS